MAMGPDDFKTSVNPDAEAPVDPKLPEDKVFSDGADIPGETHTDEISRKDAVKQDVADQKDGDSDGK